MTPVDQLPALWNAFQARWTERDERIQIMDSVVKGDWNAYGPDDEALENRSPNLVQVGIEDTAEAASLMPTVRVIPSTGSDTAKRKAEAMERLGMSYLDQSQFELLSIQSLMELVGFGFFVWVVVKDPESGTPRLEWRDPRTCYPETGWRTMDSVRSCMFARDVYVRQLPPEHQQKIHERMLETERTREIVNYLDRKVTLLEFFEEDTITVTALYVSGHRVGRRISWVPVELDKCETPSGICPVIIGQRISLDSEPRGQFDQVVQVMQAHIRLMSIVLDYADQAVYSDVWVKDLIGQMPYGGGSFIQLGPNGAIGRVQPAVSSLTVQQELDQLMTNIHLGGRWPKSRPGEIDQAIASAKFIEATAAMMNTVIRTLHLILKRALEQALRVCFQLDHDHGPDRTISGVLRNQQFLTERHKADIDLKARVKVDYGIGLGRDPAQTMVLGIQGMQTGMFSKEFVQENMEGLTDISKERARMDVESLRDMAMAQILQVLQEKTLPPQVLVQIAKERMNGVDIFDLFEKYIAQPQQEQQQQLIPSGLGGDPMMPGPAPTSGPPLPTAPDGAGLLAGLLGGGGPPGGGGPQPESIGRLSLPLPGGGFAGTQSTG